MTFAGNIVGGEKKNMGKKINGGVVPQKEGMNSVGEKVEIENTYELCDICHKAKPRNQVEKIVVIYRRCSQCASIEAEVQEFEFGGVKPQVVRRTTVKRPPAALAEAFNLPPDLQNEIISQTNGNPTNTRPEPAGGNAKAPEGDSKG
jgi:hypothetical protein